MESRLDRRRLLKSGAAAASAIAISKRSSVFAAPATIKQTGSKVKVTYWGSFSDALGEAETAVVKMFNDSQQDVELDYQFQGTYEETAQKLTAALAAKQTPDISLLSDVWWFKFYINNTLAPMNDFISANEIDTTDFVDSLYIEGVRNDKVYWLPFARSTPLFYYNKEAFTEAGLEGPPATWSEFAENAPKLLKKDGDKITQAAFSHPNAGSYIAWLFQGVDWAWGGSYSDPDFTIRINEQPSVDAGNFYRASVADGWATAVDDQVKDFVNGLCAATTASTGGLAGITKDAQFEFGTAFLPEEKGFGCSTGGAGLALLNQDSKEKQEAAFKYIAFATSPETTTYWSQNTGYMPVRKSAATSQSMLDFFATNPNFKVAVDQLAKTKPQDSARVFIPGGDQIIGKGLEQITINQLDAQAAFDDVAKTLADEAKPVIEALKNLQ
jgi:sn-glycerol 3-phosphate transport system substrate-binding protein